MNYLEIEAKTIDEAIEKACKEFNVPREKLNIEILAEGSSGLLGIGAKKARIRAGLITFDIAIEKPEDEGAAQPEAPKRTTAPREPRLARAREEIDPPAVDPRTAVLAKEILEGILCRMGLQFPVEVEESDESITMKITGDGTGLLIGRNGQTLDAIQYIINKAVGKSRIDRRVIILDTEAYRGKREEYLVSLAAKLAHKVKKTKKPVTISNMSPRDRRIIHLALKEDTGIMTKSRGEGAYRKIVILPNKKEREKEHTAQ